MDYVNIPLRNGQTAIVDEKDYKNVKDYKWGWMKNRGVAAFSHSQTILMHNLIAPFPRVSFLNGNKLDCRRQNLTKAGFIGRPGIGNPKGLSNIYNDKKQSRLSIRRKVIVDGEKVEYATAFCYKKKEVSRKL